MRLEWLISTRGLFFTHKYSRMCLVNVFTLIGIALSVMVLLTSLAVMSGFKIDLEHRILNINPHITINKYSHSIFKYQDIMSDLSKLEDVIRVNPVVYLQVICNSVNNTSNVILKGIKSFDFISEYILKKEEKEYIDSLNFDTMLNEKNTYPIIIGKVLADRLGVSVGDVVCSLVISKNFSFYVPFEIVALVDFGIYQYNEILAYTYINCLQKIVKKENIIDTIEIKIKNIDNVRYVVKKIKNKLGISFLVFDWVQQNFSLFLALRIQKIVVTLILLVVVLIAIFNVSSAIVMMVLERILEISILVSMGVSKCIIRNIFVFRGVIVSFFGVILGTVLAYLFCILLNKYKFIQLSSNMYFFDIFSVQINFWEFFFIFLFILFGCFIFSVYSSYKALSMYPIANLSKKK